MWHYENDEIMSVWHRYFLLAWVHFFIQNFIFRKKIFFLQVELNFEDKTNEQIGSEWRIFSIAWNDMGNKHIKRFKK